MSWKKRTTKKQFHIYINYAKENRFLINGKSNPRGSVHSTEVWEKLTSKLNSCEEGPKRSTKEWKKVFTEWRSTTRKKAKTGKDLNYFEVAMLTNSGLDAKNSQFKSSGNCTGIEEPETECKKQEIKIETHLDDELHEKEKTKEETEEDDVFNDSSYRTPRFDNLGNNDRIGRLADSIMAVANAINRYCDIIEKK